jgi:thioredoxin-like negative regulator of GroEL/glycosyltransferase involved in cell wall biosynthesis
MNTTIEHLLQQADQAASQENWGEVCRLLENVLDEEPQHPAALTSLGISKLHQDQPASAAEYFQEVVNLNPYSPQAYNNLGVAYALQNIWEAAEQAYQQAIDLDPENARAWRNLAEVYLQQNHRLMEGVQILAAVLKKDPRDTEALSMLAGCYEEVGDQESAALLYRQMLEVEEDHPHAAARLEDLEPEPQPSRQIARPEHAHKLAALKNLSGGNGKASASSPKQGLRSAVILGPRTFSFQRRMEGPARALAADGIDVKFSSELESADLDRFNAFIINKPHQTEELFQIVQHLIQAGKQVVADLDLDFFNLPESHPEYSTAGPGNAEAMDRLKQIFNKVDHVTVPNQSLADSLADQVSQAAVIPTGWVREGSTWEAPRPPRDTVNFGLLSTHTLPEIDPQIKEQISEAVLAAPDALLTAAGDYQILAEFDQLPDDKKLFIPLGSYQDYPYALAHMDVLLVPEKAGPFTDSKADTALLEAGIRRIPWLATRIPSYWDWGVGGIFVSGKSWSSTIQRLAENPAERKALGQAGFEKAKQRESRLVVSWWKDLLVEIQA